MTCPAYAGWRRSSRAGHESAPSRRARASAVETEPIPRFALASALVGQKKVRWPGIRHLKAILTEDPAASRSRGPELYLVLRSRRAVIDGRTSVEWGIAKCDGIDSALGNWTGRGLLDMRDIRAAEASTVARALCFSAWPLSGSLCARAPSLEAYQSSAGAPIFARNPGPHDRLDGFGAAASRDVAYQARSTWTSAPAW